MEYLENMMTELELFEKKLVSFLHLLLACWWLAKLYVFQKWLEKDGVWVGFIKHFH